MSNEFIPTLTHATERDIDLLLVEELYSCHNFVSWMAGHAGWDQAIRSATVLHSKRRTRNRREIDIFCEIDFVDGSNAAILIENKLDASEQQDQAESYREELAVLANAYQRRAMLIVCPETYATRHRAFVGKFDAIVSYEELAKYFRAREGAESGEPRRYRFRGNVLEQAIGKSRRGYEPVPNEVIGDFNARYCALVAETAPELIPGPSMRKAANPDESVSMIFDAAASLSILPPEIRPRRFAHELGKGQDNRANYVAATFAGWGPALKNLRAMFENDAAEVGASFSTKPPSKRTPAPGLVMSLPTKPANNQSDFAAQADVLRAGIFQANKLRRWLIDNQAILQKWKKAVDVELSN